MDTREYLKLIEFWSTRKMGMHPDWRVHGGVFADWVEQNLGPPPSPQHELRRDDQSGLWEPGNINWADVDPSPPPSYHDLHVTAPGIDRARLFDLPYGIVVNCNRVTGWQLYDTGPHPTDLGSWQLLGGEYDGPEKWLVLDVAGHVIVDSRNRPREDDDGEHREAAEEDRTGAAGDPGGAAGPG